MQVQGGAGRIQSIINLAMPRASYSCTSAPAGKITLPAPPVFSCFLLRVSTQSSQDLSSDRSDPTRDRMCQATSDSRFDRYRIRLYHSSTSHCFSGERCNQGIVTLLATANCGCTAYASYGFVPTCGASPPERWRCVCAAVFLLLLGGLSMTSWLG